MTFHLPPSPGTVEPDVLFGNVVDWIRDVIRSEGAPGFVMGISGTDSIVAALASARAFEAEGMPDRVLGVHFGNPYPPPEKSEDQIAAILAISPAFRSVPRLLIPWLSRVAPKATFVTDSSEPLADDHARWAGLFRMSLNGADPREPLETAGTYWVAGTRNATEQALGTYSNMSSAASVQPLIGLWKTDILRICAWLGAPEETIAASRQVDCDCGRFDLAAEHIAEIDAILAARQTGSAFDILLETIDPDLLQRLLGFIDEQSTYAGFKSRIPYMPGKAH